MNYLKIHEESRDIAVADTRERDVNSLDGSVFLFFQSFNRDSCISMRYMLIIHPLINYR